MNGYQLTKQYFAFAAANPGATTPGMCALFMWLVEVNNRSRFTQNFFFNAEDAGYACGMQSRKTVWKYLVQLECAGLVQVVYKSNNQERPSVLSLAILEDSSSGGGGSSRWDGGGSSSSCWYGGESFGEDGSSEDDSLLAGNGGISDATLVDGSELGLGFDNGALGCSNDAVAGNCVNGIGDENGFDSCQDTNTDGCDYRSFSVGGQSLHGADSADNHRLELGSARQRKFASVDQNGELPDNASHAKNANDNITLSVSKDAIDGVEQSSKTGQGMAASAGQSHHPETKIKSAYSSAETNPKTNTTHKTNPTPIITKSTAQTAATPKKATRKPATATATKPATATATIKSPARNAPPLPRRVNTASPALAHSYKGLNYPNQKNSVNGAHLGFGAMQQPDLTEVSSFFTQHGYTAHAAEKAWAHYRQANWHDVQGRPVLNWQQKCRTIWFTPENRIPTTQTHFVQ